MLVTVQPEASHYNKNDPAFPSPSVSSISSWSLHRFTPLDLHFINLWWEFFFLFRPWYFLNLIVVCWLEAFILCNSPVHLNHGSFAPFSPKGHWRLCKVNFKRSFTGSLFVKDLVCHIPGEVQRSIIDIL